MSNITYLGEDNNINGIYHQLIIDSAKNNEITYVEFNIESDKYPEYKNRDLLGILGENDGKIGVLFHNIYGNIFQFIPSEIIPAVIEKERVAIVKEQEIIKKEDSVSAVYDYFKNNGQANQHIINYHSANGNFQRVKGIEATLKDGRTGYICNAGNDDYTLHQGMFIPKDAVVKTFLSKPIKKFTNPISPEEFKRQEEDRKAFRTPFESAKKTLLDNLDYLKEKQIYPKLNSEIESFSNDFNSPWHKEGLNLKHIVTYIRMIEELNGAEYKNSSAEIMTPAELQEKYKTLLNDTQVNKMKSEFIEKNGYYFTTEFDRDSNILEIKVLNANDKQLSKVKVENALTEISVLDVQDFDHHDVDVFFLDLNDETNYILQDQKVTVFEGNKQFDTVEESKFKSLYNLFSEHTFVDDKQDTSYLTNLKTDDHPLFGDFTEIDFNDQKDVYNMVDHSFRVAKTIGMNIDLSVDLNQSKQIKSKNLKNT